MMMLHGIPYNMLMGMHCWYGLSYGVFIILADRAKKNIRKGGCQRSRVESSTPNLTGDFIIYLPFPLFHKQHTKETLTPLVTKAL